MAARRSSTRSSSKARSRSKKSSGSPIISPSTLRSVVAVALLAAGAITLIALFLPGGGILNGFVDGFLRPLFGQGAWLFGVLLLVAGVLVERAPRVDNSWVTVALGGVIVFIGGQGLIHLLSGKGSSASDLEQGGGAIGQALASTLADLVSPFGALVVLLGIEVALQAVTLAAGALTSSYQDWGGQILALVLITISAVEWVVGLAVYLALGRRDIA